MTYQQSPLVDEYIARYDGDLKDRLVWLRSAIQAAFPHTVEDMSYGMPAYRLAPGKRGIIFFAVAKSHIGLYAVVDPEDDTPLHSEIKKYQTGKGTLQFKNDEPLPTHVLHEILAYHAAKTRGI